MATLTKVKDILAYRDEQQYSGSGPSCVLLDDGIILLAFRRAYNWIRHGVYAHGFPTTEACLIRSLDGGETWSAPRVFTAGNITNQNLTLLPDGSLICLTQRGELVPLSLYEELKDTKLMTPDSNFGWVHASQGVQAMRSSDGGTTWDGPYFLSPIPDVEPIFPEWPSPAGLRASAIPLRDGGIGVAVYGHMRAKCEATNVWFMVSQDGGLPWRARGRIFRRYFPRPHRRYPGAAMIEQTTRYQEREIAHVWSMSFSPPGYRVSALPGFTYPVLRPT